ncbi:TRAP transporter small permease subunit [Nocardiopsis composta]|uniref:TRAP-type C4-dicarboxylate transport system permease small subunit n=1 Tax=Nocardiopsis composta TaxID=157465 RepID=A0A7W8QT35_9ACTN|nr:TRAP transporter small permease [Nocardiopsis composta]MBB5435465.1 TRAP-type C4-dicarboxylate transport system permease small subunit [Nocardiopsis composta]
MTGRSDAAGRVRRAVTRVEEAMMALAIAALAAMLVLMGAEVLMRYAFARPLGWSVAFIQDYLMVGMFYLGLSATYRTGAHVSVDVVYERLGPRVRLILDLLGQVLAFALFALVFYAGAETVREAVATNEIPPPGGGPLSWPSWTSYVLVPLGSGVLLLRLAATALTHRSADGAETEVRG